MLKYHNSAIKMRKQEGLGVSEEVPKAQKAKVQSSSSLAGMQEGTEEAIGIKAMTEIQRMLNAQYDSHI